MVNECALFNKYTKFNYILFLCQRKKKLKIKKNESLATGLIFLYAKLKGGFILSEAMSVLK